MFFWIHYPGLVIISLLLLVSAAYGIVNPDSSIQSEQTYGTLHIDGNPPGMEITLDGNFVGTLPESGILILDSIQSGEHSIKASSEGYLTKEVTFNVPKGVTMEVRINLIKKASGVLFVTSKPDKIQMCLDGEYKGITPAQLTGVSTGKHNVTLKLAGYKDWSEETEVMPNQEISIFGTLIPLSGGENSGTPSGGSAVFEQVIICMIASLGSIWAIKRR
jgi:hypothetical protein